MVMKKGNYKGRRIFLRMVVLAWNVDFLERMGGEAPNLLFPSLFHDALLIFFSQVFFLLIYYDENSKCEVSLSLSLLDG